MNSCVLASSIGGQDILNDANDEMLVTAAKLGEHLAFSELWNRHSNKVFCTAYRITGNRQDAEDALQESFLKAFAHLKNFEGRSTFYSWVTRIAINSALMILRRQRTHPEISIDGSVDGEPWPQWEMADSGSTTEEHYAKREREGHLMRAIHRLRPGLRNVIEIHLHDGSIKEISQIAGISVAATKSRLLRARKMLRRSLA